jgi:hypothetical protein
LTRVSQGNSTCTKTEASSSGSNQQALTDLVNVDGAEGLKPEIIAIRHGLDSVEYVVRASSCVTRRPAATPTLKPIL